MYKKENLVLALLSLVVNNCAKVLFFPLISKSFPCKNKIGFDFCGMRGEDDRK